MENIQEKMKYLTNFGQKVYAVNFNSQSFFIVENGRLTGDKETHKDYFLFDDKCKEIGSLHLGKVIMSEEEIEWEKSDGVCVVPRVFFLLTDIEISKRDLRCNGLGSMLLNWATKELQKISANEEANIPLLFIRQNSEETFAFYKKWKAELNQTREDNKIGSSCYMIIPKLEPQTKYDAEVVAEYEKPVVKKEDKRL